jgi:peptidyl-prolyl cis-trans isomerase A (cyclophilin A)
MRKLVTCVVVCLSFSMWVWSQAKTKTATPPHRGAAAAPQAPAEDTPDPIAIIDTTAGKMTCTLYPKKAPIGVDNFIGLSTGKKDWTMPGAHAKKHNVPLYDGAIFHRVIPAFMIQGGSPDGTGNGSPGYEFKNETSPDLNFDRPGRLAYANSGPDTNGSQFFITEVPSPNLNGRYTIFGQCDDASVALVKEIARMASDPRDNRPLRPVKINHITIVQAADKAGAKPAPKKPAVAQKPKPSATPK